MNKTAPKTPFSLSYLFYDFVKITAALPGLVAFRPKLYYPTSAAKKHLRSGALLIGNHNGFFDPVYMQFAVWYRRHHFICNKDFFEGPHRFFFRRFLCIPIDRDNFNINSFREIVSHLKRKEIVSMFPQGAILDDLGSFKSGMILMALQSGVPIVPVYIHPRRHWYQRLRMAIGEPVIVGDPSGGRPSLSQINQISAHLEQVEAQLKLLCEKGRTQ